MSCPSIGLRENTASPAVVAPRASRARPLCIIAALSLQLANGGTNTATDTLLPPPRVRGRPCRGHTPVRPARHSAPRTPERLLDQHLDRVLLDRGRYPRPRSLRRLSAQPRAARPPLDAVEAEPRLARCSIGRGNGSDPRRQTAQAIDRGRPDIRAESVAPFERFAGGSSRVCRAARCRTGAHRVSAVWPPREQRNEGLRQRPGLPPRRKNTRAGSRSSLPRRSAAPHRRERLAGLTPTASHDQARPLRYRTRRPRAALARSSARSTRAPRSPCVLARRASARPPYGACSRPARDTSYSTSPSSAPVRRRLTHETRSRGRSRRLSSRWRLHDTPPGLQALPSVPA